MTLLGKVFTAMVLVLSVIFFTLSVAVNATHINYRNQVEGDDGLNAQLKREQAKSAELTKSVEKLKDDWAIEQLARRAAISSLQTQLESYASEVAKKESLLAAKVSQVTTLSSTEQLTQQELADRVKENEELRKQLIQARSDRDAQFDRYKQAYVQFMRLQGEKKTLEEAKNDLMKDHVSALEKLDIIGIKPNSKLDGAPAVNGVVNSVASNLVEVSIGRDDGIKEGHKLDIYRGAAYIGRINITRSVDDKAIGEILPAYSKGFILKGDRVDSQLNQIFRPTSVTVEDKK